MILVGQYDSPYTRRVAVSLHLLGFDFEHDTRSVFADFNSMRTTNPLGRIPSLILDDGTTLIDFGGDPRLARPAGRTGARVAAAQRLARQQALQRVALASGTIDKVMGIGYERLIRPEPYRWPDWIVRCRTQAEGGLAGLAGCHGRPTNALSQAWITTACMMRYVRLADPRPAAAPAAIRLSTPLSDRCEALPAFKATYPADYVVPSSS